MDGLLRFYGDERQTEKRKEREKKMPPCFVAKAPLKLTREFYFMEQEKKNRKARRRKAQRRVRRRKEQRKKERKKKKKTELTTRVAVSGLARIRNKTVVYGKVLYI